MKKVYWSYGKNHDANGNYSTIEDKTAAELEAINIIKSEGNYYICLDSKRFVAEVNGELSDIEVNAVSSRIKSNEESEGNGSGLYANPGKVLKSAAKIFFVIGCIIWGIAGGIVANLSYENGIALFVAFIVVGVVVSYFAGLIMAALGDLAMNANNINKKIK